MTIVTICVGSSCYLHGSEEIIDLLRRAIERYDVEDEVIPVLGFCFEKCNRHGVTIQVDDDVFPGITRESFEAFFGETILPRAKAEG